MIAKGINSPKKNFDTFAPAKLWARNALFALGLGTASCVGGTVAMEVASDVSDTNIAHAQETPEEQARRHFREGAAMFSRDDFHNAREEFLTVESIARSEHLTLDDQIVSWNIAICDISLAGFELPSSGDDTRTAQATNRHNSARLETVLGFTTLEQITAVRNNLQDAHTRITSAVTFYTGEVARIDALPAPTDARARRERTEERDHALLDLSRSQEAMTFINSVLPRIEERFTALSATTVVDDHVDDEHHDDHVVTIEGREYVEHREDIWFTTPRAISLATSLAGLAASGVGLVGYVLNNADGQANLDQCRELQMDMLPCPLSLEREFQGNNDRAMIFSTVGFVGLGTLVVSAITFVALPSETRVTREPREGTDADTEESHADLRLTISPSISPTFTGVTVGGTF